jgi:capsular polysaccharide biosynthesis protein/Mrp family chromosome partitioning ATPase
VTTRRPRVVRLASAWWLLLLAPFAGGALAYAYAARAVPVYEDHAVLVANPSAGKTNIEGLAAEVPTYAELASSGPIVRAAIGRAGLSLDPARLQPNVRAESDTNTRLITIRVRSRNPDIATALANALVRVLLERVAAAASAASNSSNAASEPRLTILQPAVGASRIRPRPLLTAGYGTLAGLFAALAAIAFSASARRTVKSEDDLARVAWVPVLSAGDGLRVAPESLSHPGEGLSESYRRLSARILSGNGHGRPQSLLIVGAGGKERSAQLAANLALSVAESAGSVVLVDLSRHRGVGAVFGLGREGASAARRTRPLRSRNVTLDRFVVRSGQGVTLVFPRSSDEWAPAAADVRDVLALVGSEADFVFVHAPALGSSAVMLLWARALDAAVLVVRPARTRRDSIESSLDALAMARSNVVGAILYSGG